MFCPKCGTQLPDNAEFCTGCGAKLSNAPTAKEPFKLPTYRELLSLAFATIIFILAFTPYIDMGPSVSMLAIKAFTLGDALLGIAKIFNIISLFIYIGYVAVSFIDLGIPSAIKKFIPLGFYGLFCFSQLFVFIFCIANKGVTMGAAWYVIMAFLACAVVYELVPKLFKVEDK